MKKFKIILGLIIFLGIGGITYGIDECVIDSECGEGMICSRGSCIISIDDIYTESNQTSNTTECNTENCDGICQKYGEGDEEEYICIRNDYGDLGIYITTGCLLNGQCKMNIYETIGIRKSNPNPDVKTFAQDIILGATMFFGTVMTVLFIVSGLSYVMAGFNGKSPDKAEKMMVGSIVGLLFVTFSYTIIRLIQFFATGGS